MRSTYGVCSLIARSRGRAWRDERPCYKDVFSANFGKSHPDSLYIAVTDTKHILGNALASSLHNDIYVALSHATRDKVAGARSWSTMNLQGKIVAVMSSQSGESLPT